MYESIITIDLNNLAANMRHTKGAHTIPVLSVESSQVKKAVKRHDSFKNNMRFLVLIISLILACVSSAAQEEDISNKACGNCKHKLEYCDPYESTCQPCEAICLPPTNQKFAECGKLCHNFIQDILIGMVYFSYIYDSFED